MHENTRPVYKMHINTRFPLGSTCEKMRANEGSEGTTTTTTTTTFYFTAPPSLLKIKIARTHQRVKGWRPVIFLKGMSCLIVCKWQKCMISFLKKGLAETISYHIQRMVEKSTVMSAKMFIHMHHPQQQTFSNFSLDLHGHSHHLPFSGETNFVDAYLFIGSIHRGANIGREEIFLAGGT